MPLSVEERESFLAEPHVAALSVAAGPDRAPVTVPIWYHYSPGGEIWILTPAESRKTGLIAAAGRVTFMADRVEPTVRYVSVEGPVTRTEPGTREHLVSLAHRYLPPPAVEGFVQAAWGSHGDEVVIHVRPQRWLSADLG